MHRRIEPVNEIRLPSLRMRAAVAITAMSSVFAACRSADAAPRFVPAERALGPYSGSVAAAGFVFASGKVGADRASFATEVTAAIDAVQRELAGHELSLRDVVSVTVHLTDMADYAAFNALYAERFVAPHPARTCVAVAALPGGARVEITVIARAGASR